MDECCVTCRSQPRQSRRQYRSRQGGRELIAEGMGALDPGGARQRAHPCGPPTTGDFDLAEQVYFNNWGKSSVSGGGTWTCTVANGRRPGWGAPAKLAAPKPGGPLERRASSDFAAT